MILRNRLQLALLLSSSLGLAAVACGGIADPTKGGSEGTVATVSGALTGVSVPANARVALVWRKPVTAPSGSAVTSSVEVGSEAPVVGGKFTMNLSAPSDAYFFPVDGSITGSTPVADSPVPEQTGTGTPASGSSGSPGTSSSGGSSGAFGSGTQLTPKDIVGGSITEPLSGAVAGFVVYVDANGNGKLDLEGDYASSPDQILGGNQELMLAYLKGGGSLDYEKLRDKSGILPTAGFDLAWTEGRWLPLNDVELKLTPTTYLPSAVCNSYGYAYGGGSSSSGSAGSGAIPPSGGSSGAVGVDASAGYPDPSSDAGVYGYPSPTDPYVTCAPDGRSYSYNPPTPDCPAPPVHVGLCAGDAYETTACAGPAGGGGALGPGDSVPPGWPCTVATDGGGADASVDSGTDGGAKDAGSFDGG